jgi:hypothetical protein
LTAIGILGLGAEAVFLKGLFNRGAFFNPKTIELDNLMENSAAKTIFCHFRIFKAIVRPPGAAPACKF